MIEYQLESDWTELLPPITDLTYDSSTEYEHNIDSQDSYFIVVDIFTAVTALILFILLLLCLWRIKTLYFQQKSTSMEKLSVKELRQTLDWMLQLAQCPVCHETLSPAVVQCVRGHPVCATCHEALPRAQQLCPQCRGEFSNNLSVFIQQVIESLPHPCRHQGCSHFVKTKDDHEKRCPYKPTHCRYCDWSGASKILLSHLTESHARWVDRFLSPEAKRSGVEGMSFNPTTEGSVFTPILVDGHFFWGEMKNEPGAEKLTAIFHPMPRGKTTSVFKGSVRLNRTGSYRADIKLNMDPEANAAVENCISIPTSILHKFTVNNKFEYTITVSMVVLESMYNFVQSKLEQLKK